MKNGLLPIIVDPQIHKRLFELVEKNPAAVVNIDLATQTLNLPDGQKVIFPIDAFSKACLLNGVDELGYILSFGDLIIAFERNAGS